MTAPGSTADPSDLSSLDALLADESYRLSRFRWLSDLDRRIGSVGVVALFTVASIVMSELITVVVSLFVQVGVQPFVLSFAIPALVAPPLTYFCVSLIHELDDLHEKKHQLADAYRRLALNDQLTGLPNRRGLSARLAAEPGRYELVGMADIDRFKEINDTHGHDVGDRALVAVAARLRAELGEEAVVARTGGDEFVLMLPAPRAPLPNRLQVAVQDGVTVEVALGWQQTVGDGIDQALSGADRAMYRVKLGEPGDDLR